MKKVLSCLQQRRASSVKSAGEDGADDTRVAR